MRLKLDKRTGPFTGVPMRNSLLKILLCQKNGSKKILIG